jgi:septal ring factor EnvC (AmiA/AmiB activator)
MAALEAAQVPLREVLQDAVLRDKALDGFEAAKERELQELRARNETRIESLKAEMEALLRKINVEIEKLKRESEEAAEAFKHLQQRKRQEESRMHEVVAHFIEGGDNPVTLAPPAGPGQPRSG